jgi:hypothetical protein
MHYQYLTDVKLYARFVCKLPKLLVWWIVLHVFQDRHTPKILWLYKISRATQNVICCFFLGLCVCVCVRARVREREWLDGREHNL